MYRQYIENLKTIFNTLLPRYDEEGKSYLTIAFGCTGKKHCSVTVAEDISAHIKSNGFQIQTHRREIKDV